MSQPLPKYLPDVVQLGRALDLHPGEIHGILVAHDAWCQLLLGLGPCNCEPEVRDGGRLA
jgi:hypothetical protein